MALLLVTVALVYAMVQVPARHGLLWLWFERAFTPRLSKCGCSWWQGSSSSCWSTRGQLWPSQRWHHNRAIHKIDEIWD